MIYMVYILQKKSCHNTRIINSSMILVKNQTILRPIKYPRNKNSVIKHPIKGFFSILDYKMADKLLHTIFIGGSKHNM